MINPTQTLSISRLLLPGSLDPLVFSATDGTGDLGLMSVVFPGAVARNGYAPTSRFTDGSELTSTAWEKTNLNFEWCPDTATTETEVQAFYAEVWAAIGQRRFEVTTKNSDAPEQVWVGDRGSMPPTPRGYVDLAHLKPVYAVSIPVHPIPGSA